MPSRDDSVAVVIALAAALATVVLALVVATTLSGRPANAGGPGGLESCAEWSDGCVVCQRPARGGEANCSMPGIACTRGAARCLRPL